MTTCILGISPLKNIPWCLPDTHLVCVRVDLSLTQTWFVIIWGYLRTLSKTLAIVYADIA